MLMTSNDFEDATSPFHELVQVKLSTSELASTQALPFWSVTPNSCPGSWEENSRSCIHVFTVLQVGAGRRVFELMDRVPQLPPSGSLTPSGSPAGAFVDFRTVHFSYPSRPGSWVLEDFNLTIQPGQTVALVGSSGGGKSTVVKLVQRFYDPQQGAVLFDGVDLKDVDRMYLHQQVAMVAQEPLIFAESILYNIKFGVHRADVTQVRAKYQISGEEVYSDMLAYQLPQAVHHPVQAACKVFSHANSGRILVTMPLPLMCVFVFC